MNWQSIKLRVAKLERMIPRPPSPEEREWEEFDRRLAQSQDPNLIRIVQSVWIWFEVNPGATVDDLFGQATAGLPGTPTELTQEDLTQFVAEIARVSVESCDPL
jgi:hypothetical protein